MKKALNWLSEYGVVMYTAVVIPFSALEWRFWAVYIPFIILLIIHDEN